MNFARLCDHLSLTFCSSFPPERAFYYRLLRLASNGVDAIFVIDGAQRPFIKRNRCITDNASTVSRSTEIIYKLIDALGFYRWQAPAEAEAECARLEQLGIIDAVITEDSDALTFGARNVLRGWPDLKLYIAERIENKVNLRPEGLVMIALAYGCDYQVAGINKCGLRTALEIANAGYGEKLLTALLGADSIST